MKSRISARDIAKFESHRPPSNLFYGLRENLSDSAILINYRNWANGWSSIPSVLKACASVFNLAFGLSLHCECIKLGVDCDVMVGTSLVDMYGKCGDMESSRKMFDHMPERNVISWNAMICGYARNGDMESAFFLFKKMVGKTSVTWNEMIGGCAKSGDMGMARRVFESVPEGMKNVVTWTVMVDGYVKNGDMKAAEEVFAVMPERNFHVWSVMISGYFKIGDAVKARRVFDRMGLRSLVIWNSLISGYAQNGMCKEGLGSFARMREEGFEPDEVTVVSVLSICAQSGMLDVGKELHDMIIQKGMYLNEFVLNGLVDMYAKCGDLASARLIFEGMAFRNCATWNALITGLAIHGQCKEALAIFGRMEESGVKPDGTAFLSVLSACAHGGLVEEGIELISRMEKYELTVNKKHYGCLVDLLGRAGELQQAMNLVEGMPVEPNDTVLGALLSACRVHSNTIMAENVLKLVRKLNADNHPHDHSHYVLLSNIYASCERWEIAEGTRAVFSDKGLKKVPGCSALAQRFNKGHLSTRKI